MNLLALYLQHLVRYDARSIVFASGEGALLRLPQGDRRANQPTSHADLLALVQEIAPPEARVDIGARGKTNFRHHEKDIAVDIEIVSIANGLRMTVTPAKDDEPSKIELGAAPPRGAAPAQPTARPGPAVPAAAPPPQPKSAVPAIAAGASRLDRWLYALTHKSGSDLHLCTGVRPMARIHGEVVPIDDGGPLTDAELRTELFRTMPELNREEFEKRKDTDWAYEIPGLSRFRCNAYMDRKGIGGVLRRIPFEILSAESLGLPKLVLDLCNLTKGLVLVTGPTGSGKSTTLATLIDVINSTRDDHLITIEDPIEFVHENKKCLINQREVRTHTDSFKSALRAALREDPDVVLVGEMRDLETVAIAIETAETGHLVFGTLHTTTAPGAVDRIIDQFPADRQSQIRTMLSESLKGVIAQVLCKKKGGGRAAAYEILMGVPAVANLIREGKTFQLPSIMQTSRSIGMCTMNDSLGDLVKRGIVDPKEAYMKSVNKGEMKTILAQLGHVV